MKFKAQKPLSESEANSTERAVLFCVRSLSKYAQSTDAIRKKLLLRGFTSVVTEEALQKCLEYRYLDDEELTARIISSRLQSSSKAGYILKTELRQKGLQITAEEFLDLLPEANSILSSLTQSIQKRFQNLDDDKTRQKCMNYYLRRGYSYSQLKEVFRNIANSAME